MRHTGGTAVGATSTRSSPFSCASGESLGGGHHAQLLVLIVDDPYLADPDHLVDSQVPCYGAVTPSTNRPPADTDRWPTSTRNAAGSYPHSRRTVNERSNARGPPASWRSSMLGSGLGTSPADASVPAMTGPEDQIHGAGTDLWVGWAGVLTSTWSCACLQFHRMPAARLRAKDARIATAQVRRVNFSFTLVTSIEIRGSIPATGRPRTDGRSEVPGFASPSRDGFALDGWSTEGVLRPRRQAMSAWSARTRTPWYRGWEYFAGGPGTHHPAWR